MWLALAWAGPAERQLVERFVAEGAARGIDVATDGVRVRFAAWLEQSGFCRDERRPIVFLDRQIWRELDAPAREALLFHELGHCLLDAEHDNRVLPTGEWASLMRGGELPEGKRAWLRFEGAHRDAYLDALFAGAPVVWPAVPEVDGSVREVEVRESVAGVADLQPADGLVELILHTTTPSQGTRGLLWQGTRTVYLGVSAADGVTFGDLAGARPWGNVPGEASRLWIRVADGRLWLGADDDLHLVVPLDEVGEAARAGAYQASGAGRSSRARLEWRTAP